MICILKTIVATIILMIVSTNIIGLILRKPKSPKINTDNKETIEFLQNEYKSFDKKNNIISIVSIIVAIVYLFTLFYFWNIWLSISALLFMLFRLPDLLWEIKNNQKINHNNMPNKFIYKFIAYLTWLIPLLIYYSFYITN